MINFIKNKRLIVLILFIVSVFSIVWIFSKNKDTPIQKKPTPMPAFFELKKTIPSNGIGSTILPTTAIEFVFTKSLNPSSLTIKIEPQDNPSYELSKDNRIIYIRNIPTWNIDQEYTIIIGGIKSSEGDILNKPIEYKLKLEKPKDSPMIEKYF